MKSPIALGARVVAVLAFAFTGACASSPPPPPQAPVDQAQTTSATVPRRGSASSPSYGDSDIDAWSDPAASGYANHGSANPGTTSPPIPPRQ
jgi:hypothetical protein